jgi:endonuclease/exonuclease/phosphatase family metal-dependent hydrolase
LPCRTQPWNAFARCPEQALAWEQRRPRIAAWIAGSPHHVLALQEVVFEKRHVEAAGEERWCVPAWLEDAAAQAGFAAVMQETKQADIEKNAARNLRAVGRATPTGQATLFKRDLLQLTGAKHGSGSGSVLFLTHLESGKRVAVGNTHLVGDPAKSDSQLKQLAGLAKNMAGGDADAARIVCGDFNATFETGDSSAIASWMTQEALVDSPTPASGARARASAKRANPRARIASREGSDAPSVHPLSLPACPPVPA